MVVMCVQTYKFGFKLVKHFFIYANLTLYQLKYNYVSIYPLYHIMWVIIVQIVVHTNEFGFILIQIILFNYKLIKCIYYIWKYSYDTCSYIRTWLYINLYPSI